MIKKKFVLSNNKYFKHEKEIVKSKFERLASSKVKKILSFL